MSVPYPQATGQFPPPAPARGPLRPILGAVLVLPALAMLIWSYVWPTIWNVWNSFRKVPVFGTSGGSAGTKNYTTVFHEGLLGWLGFALTLAAVPLLVVVLIAPALAWAANRTGTVARWVVRVAIALPLAAYAPTAMAAGWYLDNRAKAASGGPPPDYPSDVRTAVWLGTFGLGCAIATTAYLAALRRRVGLDRRQPVWPAVMVVGGVLALAAIAMAIQQFTYPWLLTQNHAGTRTPLTEAYSYNWNLARLGAGAAIATLLLVLLGILGVAATVLMIVSRLRIEVDRSFRTAHRPTGWPAARIVAVVATVLLLAIVILDVANGLGPWLSRLGDAAPLQSAAGGQSATSILTNTWVPTLVSTVVAVLVALLAAVGIGALRPLGRWSELLLLPFAPWLFVGTGPLSAPAVLRANHQGGHGSWFALVPPTWVAIPVLFVATLLLRGQEARLRASGARDAGAVLRTLVQPVLPVLPLLFGAVWLWQSQDLSWQVVAGSADRPTAPAALVNTLGGSFAAGPKTGIGGVLPVAMLVVFVLVVIAAQLAYLDRVAIRVGREDDPVAASLPS